MRLRKRQRLTLIALAGLLLLGATALVLTALRDSMAFFISPSEVAAGAYQPGQRFRLGGLVEAGSVARDAVDATVRFSVTDQVSAVPVTYTGLLPDLFREGQGIVAEGTLRADGVFEATEVLAKHDENYMPPEAAEALKRAENGGAP